MKPEERADMLEKKCGDELRKLGREAVTVLRSRRNLDTRAWRIFEIFDEASHLILPFSPCRKGCSNCCSQSIIISDWEAEQIAKFTGRKRGRGKRAAVENADMVSKVQKKYIGKTCPFLKENLCSIYMVRPQACRLHFSMADDPFPCDTVKNPGATVPYLNVMPWQQIAFALFAGAGNGFGDIRDYFAEG